jgi:hypothetical protein
MSRCFFVKSRAPQGKVSSNPPQDIRFFFVSLGPPDRDESGPARRLV